MGKAGGIQKEKPSYEGHRERLRKRFLEGGLEGFLDYEFRIYKSQISQGLIQVF